MNVLITGARGQLAGVIAEAYRGSAHVRAYSRDELDIGDPGSMMARVRESSPDLIINCAAYNNVDEAEEDPHSALRANAIGVLNAARAAEASGATLVHYSTDFVFDGTLKRPYTEADAPNPQSVYAQSKLMGEWFALEAPRAFVLRVESLFGGETAKSSIDRIAQALKEGREARVFSDRIVSPSYVVDVAAATRALVERGEPGLYHCVSTGHSTWLDVGKEIARVLGRDDSRLIPVSVADVALRAPRPQFAALSADKLRPIFPMPSWQDAIRRYLA